MRVRTRVLFFCAVLAAAAAAAQQPPMDDLRMIRYKISAGDLASAESILEVHRAEKGEDAEYLLGLAWLARGSALTGDWKSASSWAKAARTVALAKLGTPAVYENNSEATYALGTAIEVDAQVLAAAGKKEEAIRLLDESSRTLKAAPYNLRARIWKRRNQIELVGQKAPAFPVEDHLGADVPTLESLRGKPVILFFWWESCGDCKSQAAALRKVVAKYASKDVVFLAPTRFYGLDHVEEKALIAKSWKQIYDLPESVGVPISDEAMLRYGVSATPTFVFIDRNGVVTKYLPYRMTEDRLSATLDELLK
jgi:thiol-disulfide isomerase/thioredoxin